METTITLQAKCDEADRDILNTAVAIKKNRLVNEDGEAIINLICKRRAEENDIPLNENFTVRHKDGNVLNFERDNIVTIGARADWGTKSKYRGVTSAMVNGYKRWIIQYKAPDGHKIIKSVKGIPENEVIAAKLYDSAIRKYNYDLSKLNFPTEEEKGMIAAQQEEQEDED